VLAVVVAELRRARGDLHERPRDALQVDGLHTDAGSGLDRLALDGDGDEERA